MQTQADWRSWLHRPYTLANDWQAPATKVPTMQRRRFSNLSRLVLSCVQELPQASQADFSVFASRHGEIVTTYSLLENLVQQQPISPIGFSQSVHNTSAGLFTLIEKIQQASTTIAAQQDTFAVGLIEAACYLNAHPEQKVLLVCFDSTLVAPYQTFLPQTPFDYCVAFLLSRPQQEVGNHVLSLTLTPNGKTTESPHLAKYPAVCHFLQWWLAESDTSLDQANFSLPCSGQMLHVTR
nr:beta-ketoacyl synthase chain length factor [Motilimonas sp. E26]